MAYDNGMCANVWAQQDKASGKTGNGNMSFEGATLYSYRTPIGRFVDTVDGRRAVLVTSNSYSITTSGKHMPALRRAIDYGRGNFAPCFTVPYLCGGSGLGYTHFDLTAEEHAANLAHLIGRYDDIVAKASRARSYYQAGLRADLERAYQAGLLADLERAYQARLLADLERAYDTARDYAAAFGLAAPEPRAPQFDFEAIEAKRAKRNAPGAAEKREREAAKRAERKERKEREAREKAEAIADWRAGLRPSFPYTCPRVDENGGALLRVYGEELQTSQGARVPLADAVKVFRFVKLCKERGEAWRRNWWNGRTLPVGAFQVDHVAPNGAFRVGCHLIHWPEIEAAARAAGVLDIAPADTREGEAHA